MKYSIQPIDTEKEWNNFVFAHSPQSLFQTWQWGEVQSFSRSKIFRFGLWESDTLVGVFQVVKVMARRGSFLHVRHGPIFSDNTKSAMIQFTEFMKKLCLREKTWFFRISPLLEFSVEEEHHFQSLGYKSAAIHAMDAENCWVLPLFSSPEELLSAMRKTTRYEIRKADKMGVKITSSIDPNDLNEFFVLYTVTAKRHSFTGHVGIAEEFDIFAKRGEAMLYFAHFEDKIIATAIILFVGNQAIYHHGASISNAQGGSYRIQWEAILEAKKRGMEFYNFWGIAPEDKKNHPWAGITLFKKGFGGYEKKYLHAQDFPVTPMYWIPRFIETVRRIKKGY